MTAQDAETKAREALVKLLESDDESIVLAAASTIYVHRPHAVGKQVAAAA